MTQPRLLARRALVASVLALAAAQSPALAFAAEKKSVEAGKVFPYLENYWKLPAGERNHFQVAYYLQRDGKPATGVKAALVLGAVRTPLNVAANGRVSPLPTLAQIKAGAKVEFEVPAQTKFSMSLLIEPLARPAAEMSAPELALAVTQSAKGAKKVAGLMGLAMPTITQAVFKGVASGQAVHADGHVTALPVVKGSPVFEPGKLATARTLKFPKIPAQVLLGSTDD